MKRIVSLSCFAVALALTVPAAAQTRVGAAAVVQNDVRGDLAGRSSRIGSGDAVFRSQHVSTGADSGAKLVFLDETNLSLGANSRATLDRFVYSGDNSASAVTVNAARGAFRFISGQSDSRVYRVQTPHAVIGVRGTVFDVLASASRTIVALQEGEITVCLRSNPRRCQIVLPGGSVVVTNTAIASAPTQWTFATSCLVNTALCGNVKLAQTPQPDRPPSFAPNFEPVIAAILPLVIIGVAVGLAARGHRGGANGYDPNKGSFGNDR